MNGCCFGFWKLPILSLNGIRAINPRAPPSTRSSIEEVEAVFRSGLALPLGIQTNPTVNEQRLGLVGPNLNGRLLQIAFVLREGRVRVISARPAHKKERSQYEEVLRKISERV